MFCICGGGSTVCETSALIMLASLIIGATNNVSIHQPFSCVIFAVSFQVSVFSVVVQSDLACQLARKVYANYEVNPNYNSANIILI